MQNAIVFLKSKKQSKTEFAFSFYYKTKSKKLSKKEILKVEQFFTIILSKVFKAFSNKFFEL